MIDESVVTRFMAVFSGLNRAYGRYLNGQARTILKPVGKELYIKHLEGKQGLGIVPVNDKNMCIFGAIDIDNNGVNHVELEKKVIEYDIPLVVCRSKSGGAHLYSFQPLPGVPASVMQMNLSSYASRLGYGNSEIFPKQTRLRDGEAGNWINLPYYNSSERVAVINGENAELTGFLDLVDSMKSMEITLDGNGTGKSAESPPCLVWAMENGIPISHRNETLFNMAIFLKRAHPADWEDRLVKINMERCDQPLPRKELEKIIKSVDKKDYRYRCTDPLIAEHCDRLKCAQIQFGIGTMPNSFDNLMMGRIIKVMTDPPHWIVDLNGKDTRLTTEELMDYQVIRKRGMELHNLIWPFMKREEWAQILKSKMKDVKELEAPEDASKYGDLYDMLREFMSLGLRNVDRGAMTRGIPCLTELNGAKVIAFRSQDFVSFLKKKRFRPIQNPDMWMALRQVGCDHTKVKVEDRAVQVWYSPYDGTMDVTPKDLDDVSEF
jgi:hypothetical protein